VVDTGQKKEKWWQVPNLLPIFFPGLITSAEMRIQRKTRKHTTRTSARELYPATFVKPKSTFRRSDISMSKKASPSWDGEPQHCQYHCFRVTDTYIVKDDYACPCGGVSTCENCGCCRSCGVTSDAEASEIREWRQGALLAMKRAAGYYRFESGCAYVKIRKPSMTETRIVACL